MNQKEYQFVELNGFLLKNKLIKKLKDMSFHTNRIFDVKHFVLMNGDEVKDFQNIFIFDNYVLFETMEIDQVNDLLDKELERKSILVDIEKSRDMIAFCSYLKDIISKTTV